MTREEWEYRIQEMKVNTVKLPESDERKAVLQDMMRTFEEMFALYDQIDEDDPEEAQRFVVEMCKALETAFTDRRRDRP